MQKFQKIILILSQTYPYIIILIPTQNNQNIIYIIKKRKSTIIKILESAVQKFVPYITKIPVLIKILLTTSAIIQRITIQNSGIIKMSYILKLYNQIIIKNVPINIQLLRSVPKINPIQIII